MLAIQRVAQVLQFRMVRSVRFGSYKSVLEDIRPDVTIRKCKIALIRLMRSDSYFLRNKIFLHHKIIRLLFHKKIIATYIIPNHLFDAIRHNKLSN